MVTVETSSEIIRASRLLTPAASTGLWVVEVWEDGRVTERDPTVEELRRLFRQESHGT